MTRSVDAALEAKVPVVSVVIACKNVASFIDACLDSVRQQTLSSLEILVVDDQSTDETLARIQAHAASDERVKILKGSGTGPASARNLAISAALGEWIAVLDGDDLMHPMRLEVLTQLGAKTGVALVADELLAFTEDEDCRTAWPFFGDDLPESGRILLGDLFRRPKRFLSETPLGYLKLVARRDLLKSSGCSYDEGLIIGEDFDFLARLLAFGASLAVTPRPYYFYRRHSASISHRLDERHAKAMVEAGNRFIREAEGAVTKEEGALIRQRQGRLRTYAGSVEIITLLKARAFPAAIKFAAKFPGAAALTVAFLMQGRWRKLLGRFNTSKSGKLPLLTGYRTLLLVGDQVDSKSGSVASNSYDQQGLRSIELIDEGAVGQAMLASKILSESFQTKTVKCQGKVNETWLGYVRPDATFSINKY